MIESKFYLPHAFQTFDIEPNMFTLKDGEGVTFPHKDALVITIVLPNYKVHRVLVDDRILWISNANAK